ncbi:hypothetical protein D5018_15830 [Parashewanella curva]|uniref:Uncharacterized protein n=1 Tax=Parashewanella curva TaxID=2338552 RepID=A0A3L8PWB5_9GAMM|nr:hypothetical protein [Parashewanella curva]RLV58728.1 hypothetical protein D5018_15830 [Parashewanella curva]
MAVENVHISPRIDSRDTHIDKLPRAILDNGISVAARAEGGICGFMIIPANGVLTVKVEYKDRYFNYSVTFLNREAVSVEPADTRATIFQAIKDFFKNPMKADEDNVTSSELLKEYIVERLKVAREFEVKLLWYEKDNELLTGFNENIGTKFSCGKSGDIEVGNDELVDTASYTKERV